MQDLGTHLGTFIVAGARLGSPVKTQLVDQIKQKWIPPPHAPTQHLPSYSVRSPSASPLASTPNEPIDYLKNTTQHSKPLLRIRGMWPFDLFHNDLFVESHRIVLHERYFFGDWSDMVKTIIMTNIVYCEVSESWFFAQLTLQDKFGDKFVIGWLRRSDAWAAKELIEQQMMQKDMSSTTDDDEVMQAQLRKLLSQIKSNAS